MQSMNSVVIEGNLTRDPVLRETPKGNTVAVMSIASNRYFGTGDERTEEVSFFEVEAWNNLGNNCYKHLTKGRGVRVAGRLKQDRWQTAEGDNRSRIKVIASTVDFKPQIIRQADDARALADSEDDLEDNDSLDQETDLLAKALDYRQSPSRASATATIATEDDETGVDSDEGDDEEELPDSVYASRPEAQIVGVAEGDLLAKELADDLRSAPDLLDGEDLEPTLAKISRQARKQKAETL